MLIADDHAMFRQGVRSVLGLVPDTEVIGEVGNVDAIAPLVDELRPDVLLLDLQLDRLALSLIPELAARVAVVVVTASERREPALQAIRSGARGYVEKLEAFETLLDAVRAVAAGGTWYPPELRAAMDASPPQDRPTHLTKREREILALVALGLRNAEIARRVFVTESTVKAHVHSLLEKLMLRDRTALARYALQHGYSSLDD